MRSYLIATIFLFVLFNTSKNANAQSMEFKASPFVATASGSPLMVTSYSDYIGSPFFNQKWAKANVILRTGTVIKDTLVKYSDLKDELFTRIGSDRYGFFNNTVIAFTITNPNGTQSHFNIFPDNGKFADGAFFEVLSNGETKLLKKNAKTITETKEGIGTAVVTPTIVDNIDYYLLINGKAIRIKKDRKNTIAILKDKQKELHAYIQTARLNLKNDNDLIRLINYYNTL